MPNDVVAQMLLASAYSIEDRFRDTTLYTLNGIDISEFENVFSPIDYKNGIVFSADKKVFSNKSENPWTGNSYLDLYYMEKGEEGKWLSPLLLQGEINDKYHEGPLTFSKDGNTVYFTRSNYVKKKMILNVANENNLKIFKAELIDGKWTNLSELPFNSGEYSCGHPTLTKDGKRLYFISSMPGGYGGTDLYYSELNNGEWSSPVNLGEKINTPGNEMFPFIYEDGTLYFSSDAHNSMGGLDVFMT